MTPDEKTKLNNYEHLHQNLLVVDSYMSPEYRNMILKKKTEVDTIKSNIFSMGVILLKAVCQLNEKGILSLNNS